MPLTAYQQDVLTRTVLGEAANQGPAGMAAVASVIKNRAGSGQFPTDPAETALQHSGPWYQFTANADAAHSGNSVGSKASPNSSAYQQAAAIVNSVFNGDIPDPTGGALYYHTSDTTAPWDSKMYQTAQIGAHTFYSPSPVPPADVPSAAPTASAVSAYTPDTSVPGAGTAFDALSQLALPTAVPLAPDRSAQNSLVGDDFAALNPGPSDLGLLLGMNPVSGSAATSLGADGNIDFSNYPQVGNNPADYGSLSQGAGSGLQTADIFPSGGITAAGGGSGIAGASAAGSGWPVLPAARPAASPLSALASMLGFGSAQASDAGTVSSGTPSPAPIYTGQGIAGTVQLPAGVRPNVTVPDISELENSPGSSSSGSGSNGTNYSDTSWQQLFNSFSAAPSGTSSMAMNDPNPSYSPGADLASLSVSTPDVPQYVTISKQVQVPASQPIETGSGVHWDPAAMDGAGAYVLDTAAPAAAAPTYKTVQVKVPNPAYVAPAAAPVGIAAASSPTTKVQQLQAQGYSPSQAYNTLAAAALATNVNNGGGNQTSNASSPYHSNGSLAGN